MNFTAAIIFLVASTFISNQGGQTGDCQSGPELPANVATQVAADNASGGLYSNNLWNYQAQGYITVSNPSPKPVSLDMITTMNGSDWPYEEVFTVPGHRTMQIAFDRKEFLLPA